MERKYNMSDKTIEYMCSYCGQRKTRRASFGKPEPGKCPRKNGDRPHSWVKNRTL